MAGLVGLLPYHADSSGARRRRDGKPGGPGANGYSYPPVIKRRPVIRVAGRFDQPADARKLLCQVVNPNNQKNVPFFLEI